MVTVYGARDSEPELYRGVVVWNRTKKRDDWGQRYRKAVPKTADKWISVVNEDLRIVPEDLWKRVAARRAETEGKTLRFESGRISGRPPKHATKNLLAGLATCGVCRGGLVVETSARASGGGRVCVFPSPAQRHL